MNTRTVLLWHNNGEERIYLSVNPAEMQISRPSCNRVCSLAVGGTVNAWGGRGLREVCVTTFLPAGDSPFYTGDDPESVLAKLYAWQDSGDPIRLILSGSDINDAFLIEDVTEILREGDRDVGVSLTLREYKFQTELTGGKATARQDERSAPGSYTVKSGDTLWGIASRFYGDGSRWSEIASRNGVADPKKLQVGTVLAL